MRHRTGKRSRAPIRRPSAMCAQALEPRRLLTQFVSDSTFGDHGFAPTPFTTGSNFYFQFGAMAVMNDGDLLMAFQEYVTPPDASADQLDADVLCRVNASGHLDTGFGQSGTLVYDSGVSYPALAAG